MFQILFSSPSGENFCKSCRNVKQKDAYIEKLDAKNIKYSIVGETQPQLCGCIFNIGGNIYTYVRVEGDAEAGNSAEVEVVDEFGNTKTKEVVVLWVRTTTVDECRKIAASLNRKKLSRIKKVWQRM